MKPHDDRIAGDSTHPDLAQAKLPVIEEYVAVERSIEVTGAVRVRIETEIRTQAVPVETFSQQARVERVAIGRICEAREAARYEGDVLVVPIYEEQVVVQRQLVLKEELRVSLVRSVEHGTTSVETLHERAIVERLQPDGSWKTFDES